MVESGRRVDLSYQTRQERTDAPAYYWTPADQIDGERMRLFGQEARHARTVCRVQVGEIITITDGEGSTYDCEIESATAREVTGRIVRAHRRVGEPVAQLTLAAAVGKPATFDWIVEKAVEIGAARIVPIRAAHSPSGIGGPEASRRRVERWRRLAQSAMKQSLRSVWPPVEDIVTPAQVVAAIKNYQYVWLADSGGARLPAEPIPVSGTVQAMIIVGPDAGFTEAERQLFLEAGAVGLSLGERRLRAETAAVAALTLILRHLGEL